MGKEALRTAVSVDTKKDPWTCDYLHNRWHPDIPFCGKIANNETVKIQCVDWTGENLSTSLTSLTISDCGPGGQIGNNDSANDVRDVDLTRVHYLSGPFEIEGADAGDILLVDIHDVQPLQDEPWGFTGVFAKENGGGFLDEIYPKP